MGFVAALYLARGVNAPLAPLVEPGHLEIAFEHSLRSGTLRVWVDDDLVLDEPLESRVTRKVLSYQFRKGREEQVLDITPGEHVIRVQVDGGGSEAWSRRIRGDFERGVTRRLEAKVGGLLRKELTLAWSP